MRIVLISLFLAAAPAAALAQESPTRSPEDYVCELTGECAEEAEAAPQATTGTRGSPRTSATRGFSLSKPAAKQAAKPATAAPKATARTGGKQTVKTAAVSKPKRTPGAAPRVDLRLTFQLGSAELTPQAMAEAKVFAQALQLPQLSSRKFVIEGHTDSQGGRAYNLDLSQRRARAVADYLTSLGVARDRFEVRGFGFDRPLPGRSAGDQANRRVEAVLAS